MIPLSVPNFGGREKEYVLEAIESSWVSTAGPFVSRFEEELAAYTGQPRAIAVQSGTAGLHLAMRVLGVERGDLVLCPTLTFIAAVNPVRYQGADPVFMDCDETLCMDPVKLRSYLERECEKRDGVMVERCSGRPVKGIILVHVFGNLAKMEEFQAIAREFGLFLVEDATEALGTLDNDGRMAGTFGDVGVYSFNGNKIMTTGGGGAMVARDPAVLEHAKHLSTQAKADLLYFDHDEIGYNYRMTNLQAALGVAQLEQLECFIKTKNENYRHYEACGVKLYPFREDTRSNRWFYSYESEERDALLEWLQKREIQTRPIWKLIHTLPMYRDSRVYEVTEAPKFYNRVLNLPCSTNLTKEEVEVIAEAIRAFEAQK